MLPARLIDLCEPKVDDLNRGVTLPNQDVLQLQIAMDDLRTRSEEFEEASKRWEGDGTLCA